MLQGSLDDGNVVHTVPLSTRMAEPRSNQQYAPAKPEVPDKWQNPLVEHSEPVEVDGQAFTGGDLLDFLSPAEVADLPDLDFPVPDQDVIPEMIFESESAAIAHSQVQGPKPAQGQHLSRAPATGYQPNHPASQWHVARRAMRIERQQNREQRSRGQHQQQQRREDRQKQVDEEEVTEVVAADGSLIPIQGISVAHARSGGPSAAALAERRAKNTAAARRSRARRADRLNEVLDRNADLIAENQRLLLENAELVAANETLRIAVEALEARTYLP